MRMNKHFRTALTLATLVSFLGITTACYGPFNLTRDIYKMESRDQGQRTGRIEMDARRGLPAVGDIAGL